MPERKGHAINNERKTNCQGKFYNQGKLRNEREANKIKQKQRIVKQAVLPKDD